MFDFNKVKDFDKHISLSIPHYEFVIDTILTLSDYFIEDDTNIYDIGCSTGLFLQALKERTKHKNINLIGIDNSTLIPDSTEHIQFIKSDLNKFSKLKLL